MPLRVTLKLQAIPGSHLKRSRVPVDPASATGGESKRAKVAVPSMNRLRSDQKEQVLVYQCFVRLTALRFGLEPDELFVCAVRWVPCPPILSAIVMVPESRGNEYVVREGIRNAQRLPSFCLKYITKLLLVGASLHPVHICSRESRHRLPRGKSCISQSLASNCGSLR